MKRKIDRVGIDTGGTFTDVAWLEAGRLMLAKVPSRPDAPAVAVLAGLDTIPGLPDILCHGTTVGTNAILARHGGPARMVVTKGFRDVLEIGRGERNQIYSISPTRHKPILGRDEIYEIDLRLNAAGEHAPELHATLEIARIADELIQSGAKALAVGILHSAAYPDSERELAEQLSSLTGIPAFSSSQLAAYPREYERWSLAALTAYLAPVLGDYLSELADRCPAPLVLMASSGGLIPTDQALRNPATCILSGPAGGALAAMSLGHDRVLALDMGGTSTDVTLLAGSLPRTREANIDDLPLPLPTIDIHTIGAGGGSIVKIDTGGMLALGPESAGASPGPACYGNGGPATLSDVALLSGRLIPDKFLAGVMKLDSEAARIALEEIRPAKMAFDELLDGILELARVHLTGALRKISIARGIDPALPDAPFTLVPFGGAGALFAVECARSLGLREVLHPHAAGVFSSIGLLLAPIVAEREWAILCDINKSIDPIKTAQSELVEELTSALREWSRADETIFTTTLECRYRGQTHTLEIPLPDQFDSGKIRAGFESTYRTRYTYLHHDSEIEIVTIRVRGEIPAPPIEFPQIENQNRGMDTAGIGMTKLRLAGSWIEAPVYQRDKLPIEAPINGPAIVIEDFATLYLPPDTISHLDKKGHIHVACDSGACSSFVNIHAPESDATYLSNQHAPLSSDAFSAQLAIFRALVVAFLDEMGVALRHGAFSQNIKERQDYSCALFNSSGELVLGAAHIPVHLGSMDTACRAAIEAIDMQPGDAVLLNDPYSGGTHLPDLTVIFPAFLSDAKTPEFYLGVRAHHADVGGIAPGSLPLSTKLDEEGLIIPPTLVLRDGNVVEEVVELLGRHSRMPTERRGDLRAQIAAGAVGLKRLIELADSRGLDRIRLEASGLIDHSTRVMRAFLSTMNPATGVGICEMDEIPDEPGARISCYVKLIHDPTPLLEIDFTGSSDQHPGCLNATPAIVRSAVLYSLRLFLPPDTPTTSGLLEPVKIHLRDASVLNPKEGAAVAGGNVETSQAIVEALMVAFGELGWDIPAASQGTMNNVLLGSIESGECTFSFYETIGGGAGAVKDSAGTSGIQTHMTNTRNTPVEALERAYPFRIKTYGIRLNSSGNGLNKGGDGIIREYEILTSTRMTILSHHRTTGPPGASGGEPGVPGRNLLIRKGMETELPARSMIDLKPGDIIRIETPGGGGFGKLSVES